MIRIFRIVTKPISFEKLLTGQMRFMQHNGCKVTMVCSNLAKLAAVSNEEGCDYFAISMTRQITPLKDIKALYKLWRVLKKHKPDIVHTHTPKAGLLGMFAAKLAGIKIRLHTVAGLPLMEAHGFKKLLLTYVEKFTYACATGIYPNSFKLADYLIVNRFCNKSKLKVLGNGSSNGIDTEYFKLDEFICQEKIRLGAALKITEGDFVYVFVGRMVADKGINELVAAFEMIYADDKKVKLLLVGPYENELNPLSAETMRAIERNEAILHAGYKKDVRPYLALAHVMVFPSYREGFPNVPMQAGSFNLPCIATDINGCNEIIKDGINGLLVPPKNTSALRAAMDKMRLDKLLRESCANNARAIITNSFSNKVIWNELLNEYKLLAGEKHPAKELYV